MGRQRGPSPVRQKTRTAKRASNDKRLQASRKKLSPALPRSQGLSASSSPACMATRWLLSIWLLLAAFFRRVVRCLSRVWPSAAWSTFACSTGAAAPQAETVSSKSERCLDNHSSSYRHKMLVRSFLPIENCRSVAHIHRMTRRWLWM